MKTYGCFLTGLVCFLYSCSSLSIHNLRNYLENTGNGLTQSQGFNGVKYRLMYLPHEMMYYNESKGENMSNEDFDEYLKQHTGMYYFLMDIEIEKDEKVEASLIRSFYENTMNMNNLKLLHEGSDYFCSLYHCESKSRKKYRINIGFELNNNEPKDIIVVFTDPLTGNTPSFNFSKQSFQNIPKIKL